MATKNPGERTSSEGWGSKPTGEELPFDARVMPGDDDTTDDDLSLAERNAAIDQEVKAALAEKAERLSAVELPNSATYVINQLEAIIQERIAYLYDSDILLDVERPSIKGKKAAADTDLTVNIIPLFRSMGAGASMQEVANTIAAAIQAHPYATKVTTAGPFINIELAAEVVSQEIFEQVAEHGEHYGWSRDTDPEIVVVDYSSPNVAKNLTLPHLRSTIIGQSIINLEEAVGNIPFGVNHIGDWGTHFGNIMYQYEQELAAHGDDFLAELEADPVATLMRIYRKFNEEVEAATDEDAEAMKKAGRELFLEVERGNPEYLALWRKFSEWSLRDFAPIYDRLGISFDAIQGESFYENRMAAAVQEGIEKNVLIELDDGSIVFPSQPLIDPSSMQTNFQIMLTPEGKPRSEMVVKPSGGTSYLTRDIAAITYRMRDLGAKRVLYVIGKEQGPHCIELFNIAEQMGVVTLGNAQHIDFGHLNVEGRKMSSRRGEVILLGDILDDATEAAGKVLDGREDEREVDDRTAELIGVGATVFNDLRQNRIKDIKFDPEKDVPEMMKNGGGVYIQYTFARLNSLLEKASALIDSFDQPVEEQYGAKAQKIEKDIVMAVARFPQVIKDAAETSSPHRVATYLTELCQMVNSLLANPKLRVVDAESPEAALFRAQLAAAASQVIENASKLLQMKLPNKM